MGSTGDNPQTERLAHARKLAYNLQSDNKNCRKKALVDLEKYLSNEGEFGPSDYHFVFNEIQMVALNALRDKSEPVREQALKFAQFFILGKLSINDYYLSYVFPILVERLGSVEIIEDSEEMRYQLVLFIEAIIDQYAQKEQLKPFLNDIVKIFCETVKDKYPAIKETSCRCIVKLAKALPRDFHTQAELLIKPVLTTFNHQRYKIRIEAVKCVGELIMHSSYKGLEDAIIPMAERLFDQIPIVRRTVAQVAARWLLEYKDRYSFFPKLLPLLLTGLIDEVPDTRKEAYELWEKVGLQYEQENEEDLKDKINFLNTPPKYYAEGLIRPNLGCRVLVQRNVGRMASALSNELTSWQVDIRIRCSQLLCAVALHTESGFTQHLQGILPAMYSAARDEDKHVVENITKASELLGLFVPYDTWSKLILPAIEDGPHFGHLLVLAGLIRGSPKEYIENHLEEIGKILSDETICWSRKRRYQIELISCVKAITTKLSQESADVSIHLFIIIISVVALRDKDNGDISLNLLEDVVKAACLESTYDLWSRNLSELLRIISKDPRAWTSVTSERCIFELILIESGEAFGENLETIATILIKTLDIDADPESRLKTFIALSTAFKNKGVLFKQSEDVTQFFEKLIVDAFVPSLVWHAGATAEAMRTMAASCLLSALNPCEKIDLFKSSELLETLWKKLLPLLISLAEDASSKSRALALENLIAFKELLCSKGKWTIDDLVKVYPEILKRLDDPTEFVRTCAIKATGFVFENCVEEFKSVTFKAHHEMVLDTLLTHFDDDDAAFQENVLTVFKVLSSICKDVMVERVKKHRNVLRNKSGCDLILEIINSS